MAGKKRAKKELEFRNTQLADALQTQDMAAVAFALRHGPTVVPLMRPGQRDDPLDVGEVWTYRDPRTGDIALLLFSDAAHKPETLPPGVALQSPAWLRAFLGAHEHEITTVFFDLAGEVRPVTQSAQRRSEAARLGYADLIDNRSGSLRGALGDVRARVRPGPRDEVPDF